MSTRTLLGIAGALIIGLIILFLVSGGWGSSLASLRSQLAAAAAGPISLNPSDKSSGITLSNNNYTAGATSVTPTHNAVRATFGLTSGKWYWEVFVSNGPAYFSNVNSLGLASEDAILGPSASGYVGGSGHAFGWGYATDAGIYYTSGFTANGSAPPLSNGWKRFAYEADTGKLWIGDATGWFGGGDPASGSNPTAVYVTRTKAMYPAVSLYNAIAAESFTFNFGQSQFQYVVPGGFSPPADSATPPASCTFAGSTVQSGQSVTAYQSASVPSGSTCTSQTRTCANGTLSGSYTFASCTVQDEPPPPEPTKIISVTDPEYGAKGDCSTDDTTAFQKAVDAAHGPSGLGKINIPPTSSCYLVSKINGTKRNNIIIEGVGDQSKIKINGKDSVGNWWDLSGSSNVTFRDLKIVSGSVIPKTIFLWGSVSGQNQNLHFDHVNIDAGSSAAHLYAFGYTGLSMRDGTWYQRHNGSANTNPSLLTSVVRLDNVNSFPSGATSAYVQISPPVFSWMTTLSHMRLIDAPTGYGNGRPSNNVAFTCINCGAVLSATGGEMTGYGRTAVVFWNFAEGIDFSGVTIGPTDHSINTMSYYVRTGGSATTNTVGNLTLRNIFFIGSPIAAGAYIGVENPGPNGMLALGHFQLLSPEVGANQNGAYLIAPAGLGCTQAIGAGFLSNSSRIDAFNQKLVFCGNADLSTIITDVPASGIIVPPGTTQTGCKFNAQTGYNCSM